MYKMGYDLNSDSYLVRVPGVWVAVHVSNTASAASVFDSARKGRDLFGWYSIPKASVEALGLVYDETIQTDDTEAVESEAVEATESEADTAAREEAKKKILDEISALWARVHRINEEWEGGEVPGWSPAFGGNGRRRDQGRLDELYELISRARDRLELL